MIAAVVLSGGESSRMGSPKALLSLGGSSFIERIISAFKATKVGKIIVVLGHNPEEIKKKIDPLSVTVVINQDYRKGQLSSLRAALRALQADRTLGKIDGVLVHLVDHPFLNPALVDRMIERFYESGKLIVIPRHRGKRGHPVIFSRELFGELMSTPMEQGAKAVVRAHGEDTLEIETEEEGVTVDIDTPEEYRRYLQRE